MSVSSYPRPELHGAHSAASGRILTTHFSPTRTRRVMRGAAPLSSWTSADRCMECCTAKTEVVQVVTGLLLVVSALEFLSLTVFATWCRATEADGSTAVADEEDGGSDGGALGLFAVLLRLSACGDSAVAPRLLIGFQSAAQFGWVMHAVKLRDPSHIRAGMWLFIYHYVATLVVFALGLSRPWYETAMTHKFREIAAVLDCAFAAWYTYTLKSLSDRLGLLMGYDFDGSSGNLGGGVRGRRRRWRQLALADSTAAAAAADTAASAYDIELAQQEQASDDEEVGLRYQVPSRSGGGRAGLPRSALT